MDVYQHMHLLTTSLHKKDFSYYGWATVSNIGHVETSSLAGSANENWKPSLRCLLLNWKVHSYQSHLFKLLKHTKGPVIPSLPTGKLYKSECISKRTIQARVDKANKPQTQGELCWNANASSGESPF